MDIEKLEDRAEQFIQAAVDNAPEPLRRLGEWLANKLDDDDWKTAERMLLGAATEARTLSSRVERAERERDRERQTAEEWYGMKSRAEAAETRSAELARALEEAKEALRGCVRLWDKYYQALPVAQFPDVEDEEFGEILRARATLEGRDDG